MRISETLSTVNKVMEKLTDLQLEILVHYLFVLLLSTNAFSNSDEVVSSDGGINTGLHVEGTKVNMIWEILQVFS